MDPLLRLVIDPSRPDGRAGTGNRIDARDSGHRAAPRRPAPRPPAAMHRIVGAVGRILAPLAHALADDAAERAEVWGEGLTGTPRAAPGRTGADRERLTRSRRDQGSGPADPPVTSSVGRDGTGPRAR